MHRDHLVAFHHFNFSLQASCLVTFEKNNTSPAKPCGPCQAVDLQTHAPERIPRHGSKRKFILHHLQHFLFSSTQPHDRFINSEGAPLSRPPRLHAWDILRTLLTGCCFFSWHCMLHRRCIQLSPKRLAPERPKLGRDTMESIITTPPSFWNLRIDRQIWTRNRKQSYDPTGSLCCVHCVALHKVQARISMFLHTVTRLLERGVCIPASFSKKS